MSVNVRCLFVCPWHLRMASQTHFIPSLEMASTIHPPPAHQTKPKQRRYPQDELSGEKSSVGPLSDLECASGDEVMDV